MTVTGSIHNEEYAFSQSISDPESWKMKIMWIKPKRKLGDHCTIRTRLLYRRRSQQAEMLLYQSVMWLRKVTNLWCDSEVKFLSNDYTNPNTNPKTIATLTLTVTDPHEDFESACERIFCDFIWNYSCTVDGAIVTSLQQVEQTMWTSVHSNLINYKNTHHLTFRRHTWHRRHLPVEV